MALAERMLAERFNRPEHEIVDHRTWVIAGDGDLMEGVSQEAASLAGHLALDRLCVFYDDNRITIDGTTDVSFTEDVAKRFQAYGWQVLRVGDDGHDGRLRGGCGGGEGGRPRIRRSSSVARTSAGARPGSRTLRRRTAPRLGEEEVRLTKRALGWPEDAHFLVPDTCTPTSRKPGSWARRPSAAWEARLEAYTAAYPEEADAFRRVLKGESAGRWADALPVVRARYLDGDAQGVGCGAECDPRCRCRSWSGGSADLAG